MNRRDLLKLFPGVVGTRAAVRKGSEGGKIDRRALVRRHNVRISRFDNKNPLSVGNGEFAFTADATGLQTFPAAFESYLPLCTQSQWGWHTFSNPHGFSYEQFRLTPLETHGREVAYPIDNKTQGELYNWLRMNPHRLNLGRIGLNLHKRNGGMATPDDLAEIEQELDLWTGILKSEFTFDSQPVVVETCCHPEQDALSFRIRSPFSVVFEFPYGSAGMSGADWQQPALHKSTLTSRDKQRATISRELDRDRYSVEIGWATPARFQQEKKHTFTLEPARSATTLEFTCCFSPQSDSGTLPSAAETATACSQCWSNFWTNGAAVELSNAPDARAKELERRIILSRYLTAIQCAGSLPPQETGLTCNSWYGKFHTEMHLWHAGHFARWGHAALLERSLAYYRRILPEARRIAEQQGYTGVRWPKMTGPDGMQSPSPIAPLLIWEQPHIIAMAELCYREKPDQSLLESYADLVFATADFMTSFAWFDHAKSRYMLGPPVIPVQENHPAKDTWNPTFELEYWAEMLQVAQTWRARMGLPPQPKWTAVRQQLSALPVANGLYLAHENCPQTFTERNRDHPSMLMALGLLDGTKVDREIMRRTLHKVLSCWQWPDTWGWDYGSMAMTAARLGEPETAIEVLLMDTPKNKWSANGHTWQRPNLPVYLPSNGALLLATASMSADNARGFPSSWNVSTEGFHPLRWTK